MEWRVSYVVLGVDVNVLVEQVLDGHKLPSLHSHVEEGVAVFVPVLQVVNLGEQNLHLCLLIALDGFKQVVSLLSVRRMSLLYVVVVLLL